MMHCVMTAGLPSCPVSRARSRSPVFSSLLSTMFIGAVLLICAWPSSGGGGLVAAAPADLAIYRKKKIYGYEGQTFEQTPTETTLAAPFYMSLSGPALIKEGFGALVFTTAQNVVLSDMVNAFVEGTKGYSDWTGTDFMHSIGSETPRAILSAAPVADCTAHTRLCCTWYWVAGAVTTGLTHAEVPATHIFWDAMKPVGGFFTGFDPDYLREQTALCASLDTSFYELDQAWSYIGVDLIGNWRVMSAPAMQLVLQYDLSKFVTQLGSLNSNPPLDDKYFTTKSRLADLAVVVVRQLVFGETTKGPSTSTGAPGGTTTTSPTGSPSSSSSSSTAPVKEKRTAYEWLSDVPKATVAGTSIALLVATIAVGLLLYFASYRPRQRRVAAYALLFRSLRKERGTRRDARRAKSSTTSSSSSKGTMCSASDTRAPPSLPKSALLDEERDIQDVDAFPRQQQQHHHQRQQRGSRDIHAPPTAAAAPVHPAAAAPPPPPPSLPQQPPGVQQQYYQPQHYFPPPPAPERTVVPPQQQQQQQQQYQFLAQPHRSEEPPLTPELTPTTAALGDSSRALDATEDSSVSARMPSFEQYTRPPSVALTPTNACDSAGDYPQPFVQPQPPKPQQPPSFDYYAYGVNSGFDSSQYCPPQQQQQPQPQQQQPQTPPSAPTDAQPDGNDFASFFDVDF